MFTNGSHPWRTQSTPSGEKSKAFLSLVRSALKIKNPPGKSFLEGTVLRDYECESPSVYTKYAVGGEKQSFSVYRPFCPKNQAFACRCSFLFRPSQGTTNESHPRRTQSTPSGEKSKAFLSLVRSALKIKHLPADVAFCSDRSKGLRTRATLGVSKIHRRERKAEHFCCSSVLS